MPEISRFLGIVIIMHFNEHNPPHFHVKYQKYRAQICIKNLTIIEGNLPPRIFGLVIEWAILHQKELMKNWNSLVKSGTYKRIKPLI